MVDLFDQSDGGPTPAEPDTRDGIDQRVPGLDEPDPDITGDAGFGASTIGANNALAAYSDQLQLEMPDTEVMLRTCCSNPRISSTGHSMLSAGKIPALTSLHIGMTLTLKF